MFRKKTIVSGVLLALGLPCAAQAAPDADLAQIREEIRQMRQTYEARIASLEARLKQAEEKAVLSAETKVLSHPSDAQGSALSTQHSALASNAFNPGISLILSGLYSNLSKDPADYRITGFHLPGDVLGDIRPQRGFSLAESELGIYANVDPSFYGGINFAIHPDNTVSTEEAFIQTTTLPHGLTLKAGRFFSGIGYLNEQHAHTWDFADAPLAYQAFLGGQFNNDGVQMRWLAPTDTFLELGAEAGRGANYPGTGRDKNGAGASALYAHLGGDVGASHSWRAGLSLLSTSPQDRQWDDVDAANTAVTNSFTGNSKLWIADMVWKWAPNGNAYYTNFKLQGEYLRRVEDGNLVYAATTPGAYSATQSGWYMQGIYQFAPYWRAGARTERLDSGSVDYGVNNASLMRTDYAPTRNALMVDYNPSEFSRIRLQVAQDKSRQGESDNQLLLQYQMSLGAHGAHKF
ncbi:MAG: OprO/OprP family phosphate-selective porin [Gammaproteobacteria bacterium]|nr:OprO/OprP family phosphate-selective porin [Gammaproteobacteria bacterium]